MTQLNNSDLETEYLKNKIARMSDREVVSLNQRALVTLLFVYSDGSNEFSDREISDYPNLSQRNRIVHSTVGDYFILDLLKFSGYVEGESNTGSKWSKIFLTEKGLEKAKHLHASFIANSYDAIIEF
jgi:hypothetical protein